MAIASPPSRPIYSPTGRIRDLWAYKGREVLVAGPAGTGKSRGCLEKIDNEARRYSNMRGLIARKLRTTLTQSALVTFNEKVLPEGAAERWFHHGDQEYRYPNGSIIAVAGLDDPEKVKSTEFDMIYVQEATELEENDWGMLLRGLRNGVMPYQQLMADCNPASPEHWLKKRCDAGVCHLIESRHEDNPTITPEYIATLDSLTGYLYQRLRLGLWVAAEGMYFTEWHPDIHLVEPFDIPLDWPRWTATDYGFAEPFCTLWFARDPDWPNPIYMYRELYARGYRDEEQAYLIAERSAGERIVLHVGDPSMFNNRTEQGKPSIARVYQSAGVPLVRGTNARIAGWQSVRRAMAWDESADPRLRVMQGRCPNLVRTIPEMVHDPLDPEDLADKVNGQKTEDHAVDSLRYGLMAEVMPPSQAERQEYAFARG